MINPEPKECCGCTACASICAHRAISMRADRMGFLYPTVDTSKCVECGLCETICQFNKNYDKTYNLDNPIAYAVRHKNPDEILKSRSGAAFVAISDFILDQGGVIYGAGYKDHFTVSHQRATSKAERDLFRGSKYVQSDLTDIFYNVKKDLQDGKIVLFTGTPCQTSGLRSFIGKSKQDRLFLADIVCHGVPSPYIWRDYLSYIELINNSKIDEVNFRDKRMFGWKDHKETFKLNNGDFIIGGLYTQLFYKHITFRKSCSECYFTNLKRPSDITLADFWGWEKQVPDMNNDDKGISLVLVNTLKGKSLFDKVSMNLNIQEVNIQECLQSTLQRPTPFHPLRSEFEEDYAKHGFYYIKRKYMTPNLFQKIVNKLKYGRGTL